MREQITKKPKIIIDPKDVNMHKKINYGQSAKTMKPFVNDIIDKYPNAVWATTESKDEDKHKNTNNS